jgi:hypothetical protein
MIFEIGHHVVSATASHISVENLVQIRALGASQSGEKE